MAWVPVKREAMTSTIQWPDVMAALCGQRVVFCSDANALPDDGADAVRNRARELFCVGSRRSV